MSKGYAARTDLNLKFAEIVTSNTGYPRTFGKELIRIFREVNAEQMEPDSSSERFAINHDLMLRLWRLYLEIHFEHSEKSAYEKLRLFKENLTENMNDIIVPDRS